MAGNLPPEMLVLWKSVKRMSRTEAFFKYAEEHPREVYASLDDESDRLIAEHEKRLREENPAMASSRTRTRTEVRSPTKTSTSTKAHTEGNVTVTGGAGEGATTRVTIRKNPSTRTSTRTEVRSPTKTATSTKARTVGNVTVTGGAGKGAKTDVTIRKNPDLVAVDPKKITASNTHVLGRLSEIHWKRTGRAIFVGSDAPVLAYHACGDRKCSEEGKLVIVYGARGSSRAAKGAEYKRTHWGEIGTGKQIDGVAAPLVSLRELGPLRQVVYTTRKGGDPAGELVDYDHTFGSDAPTLLEGAGHMLVIAGGGYRVTERGIVG